MTARHTGKYYSKCLKCIHIQYTQSGLSFWRCPSGVRVCVCCQVNIVRVDWKSSAANRWVIRPFLQPPSRPITISGRHHPQHTQSPHPKCAHTHTRSSDILNNLTHTDIETETHLNWIKILRHEEVVGVTCACYFYVIFYTSEHSNVSNYTSSKIQSHRWPNQTSTAEITQP